MRVCVHVCVCVCEREKEHVCFGGSWLGEWNGLRTSFIPGALLRSPEATFGDSWSDLSLKLGPTPGETKKDKQAPLSMEDIPAIC